MCYTGAGDIIPDGANMYVFCKNFIAGYAGTIAGHVGNAPDDEHARETMQCVMARMQEIEAYVKSRDSDIYNPQDGFIPRQGGSSKRHLRWAEKRASKRRGQAKEDRNAKYPRTVIDDRTQPESDSASVADQRRQPHSDGKTLKSKRDEAMAIVSSARGTSRLSVSKLKQVCALLSIPWRTDQNLIIGMVNSVLDGQEQPQSRAVLGRDP